MGGGECCVIELLNLMQIMPINGLLVVEEIEAGLHPQAQRRLVEALIKICLKKQIQIICSTHSEVFLDALPRQARLVLKKDGEEHSVIESPSTMYAMYEMTGQFYPELIIYCEDTIAAIMIEESLPKELRLRVKIQDVGSNNVVIRQGVSHIRSGSLMRSLCILDGDCNNEIIDRWIKSERGDRSYIDPDFLLLPANNLSPERWIIKQLQIRDYCDEFANQFGCSINDAQSHIEALNVELDHHDIAFILHQRMNINPNDCIRRIMRAVVPRHPQLDTVREKINSSLN